MPLVRQQSIGHSSASVPETAYLSRSLKRYFLGAAAENRFSGRIFGAQVWHCDQSVKQITL
jgi:hypothetical protein